MITSIVEAVRALLRGADDPDATAEIVFPVSDDAIAPTGDPGLPLVPGVAQTEGCSVSGGCATCPYMKMNSLDALIDLLRREGVAQLDAFRPRQYNERIAGRWLAEVGSQPILHMRAFQDSGRLPEALMCRVASLPKRD
ncbi:MAG: hypothetical protein V3V08_15165 [Nannocystaceae bacterium]